MRGALLCVLLVLCAGVHARAPRSAAEVAAFKRGNACPATGHVQRRCPDFEVDHAHPLCAGGADTRANMQWLSRLEHRTKTRGDLAGCRQIRRFGNPMPQ